MSPWRGLVLARLTVKFEAKLFLGLSASFICVDCLTYPIFNSGSCRGRLALVFWEFLGFYGEAVEADIELSFKFFFVCARKRFNTFLSDWCLFFVVTGYIGGFFKIIDGCF